MPTVLDAIFYISSAQIERTEPGGNTLQVVINSVFAGFEGTIELATITFQVTDKTFWAMTLRWATNCGNDVIQGQVRA
jgi:hypothetical protein